MAAVDESQVITFMIAHLGQTDLLVRPLNFVTGVDQAGVDRAGADRAGADASRGENHSLNP